jgi:hypothetical protein
MAQLFPSQAPRNGLAKLTVILAAILVHGDFVEANGVWMVESLGQLGLVLKQTAAKPNGHQRVAASTFDGCIEAAQDLMTGPIGSRRRSAGIRAF